MTPDEKRRTIMNESQKLPQEILDRLLDYIILLRTPSKIQELDQADHRKDRQEENLIV